MNDSKLVKSNNKWRFRVGISLLVLSVVSPAGAILVGFSSFSTDIKLVLSGLFLAGIPEFLTAVAVIVLGKPGFIKIKTYVLKFLRRYGPPKAVGRVRYYIGLVMFSIPALYAWATMYFPFEKFPEFLDHRTIISILFDVSFFASFWVLGENFWDKFRSLFFHKAKVTIE